LLLKQIVTVQESTEKSVAFLGYNKSLNEKFGGEKIGFI